MTMTHPAALDTAVSMVSPALRSAVEKYLCLHMAQVAQYHHGWADTSGRPTDARGGKLLRPALALLSAQAAHATPAEGVPAGVAIEFVHNFSLLHDDIMDGDRTRRGRATAWTLFGVPQAILAGDALLVAATSVLLDSGAIGAATATGSLMTATQRMISGQASDVYFEQRGDVTLPECVRMARDKTGALLACACSLGAGLVGASPALVKRLSDFGEHIGLAFQLIDDLLGIWGDPARTGKHAGADLRARKKSLPVVAALAAPDADELKALYLNPEPLSEWQVHRVAELIEHHGGRDWAQDEANHQITAAEESLAAAAIPDEIHGEFRELAEFVTGRRF